MPQHKHPPPPAPAGEATPQQEWDPATTRCYTPELYRAETIVAFNLARLAAQVIPDDVSDEAERTQEGSAGYDSGILHEASVTAL